MADGPASNGMNGQREDVEMLAIWLVCYRPAASLATFCLRASVAFSAPEQVKLTLAKGNEPLRLSWAYQSMSFGLDRRAALLLYDRSLSQYSASQRAE